MKKAQLPGMIKYGSIKEALRDITKKTTETHDELRRLAGEAKKKAGPVR